MADLDSRFDPRFQRGYDGSPVGPPPSSPSVAVPAASDDGPETPKPHDVVPEPDELPREPDDIAAEPPRRNRWSVALLVVSIACIVLGAASTWSSASQGGTSGAETFDVWRQVVSQLGYSLPQPLLTAGTVGAVLWLALMAIEKMRSRP